MLAKIGKGILRITSHAVTTSIGCLAGMFLSMCVIASWEEKFRDVLLESLRDNLK